jgi:hypothetical protein
MPGNDGRRAREPGATYTLTTASPPNEPRSAAILPGAADSIAECRGCGAVTDLVQGSDWCWTCTYDPICLCIGRPGATNAATDPGGSSHGR